MINEKLLRYLLFFILLGVTCFNIISVLISQKEKYLYHNYWQGFPSLKQIYLDSQYINKHPKGWIPDEAVNSYAAGAYIKGIQPQLIAPDTPPLGRYLIGLSALAFGNPNIITIFSATLSLLGLYLVANQIFKNKLLAMIPLVGITSEPILKNQLIYTPLLDIIQLVFLVFSFYFFNKAIVRKNSLLYFVLTAAAIGCFIATKFFITGITIVAAMLIVLLVHKQIKRFTLFLFSLVIAPFILFLSYATALFHGYSFRSFIGIQKWIFLYHKSQLILPFSIWPLLFLNKWFVWFGNKPVISDAQWAITWPILMTMSVITIVLYFLRKIQHTKEIEVLFAWIITYILFFSFGQISSRYLVIYIPILYITALYGVVESIRMVKKVRKR